MEREKISPLATSVTLGEKIHRLIDEVQGLLIIGVTACVWIVLFGAFWITGFPLIFNWLLPILGIIGVIIVFLAIPFIFSTYKTYKALEQWNEEFIRFSYILKFEILPSENPDQVERILEQTLNVFVRLGDIFEANQINHKPYIGAKVEGKKDSHTFDIYVGVRNTKDQKKLHSFHKENGDLFVRRFAKTGPVKESDLKAFFSEVSDVVKKTKSKALFRIIAISESSFDKSAKVFMRNKKNWIIGKSADLIEETPEGFRVIWVS